MSRNNELSPAPANTYDRSTETYEGSPSGVDSGTRVTAPPCQDPLSEKSGIRPQWCNTSSVDVADSVPHYDEHSHDGARSKIVEMVPNIQPLAHAHNEIAHERSHTQGSAGRDVVAAHPPPLGPSLEVRDIPIMGVDFSFQIVAIAIERKRMLDERRRQLEHAKQKIARLPAELDQKVMDLNAEYDRRRAELNMEHDQQRVELIRKIDELTQLVAAEDVVRQKR